MRPTNYMKLKLPRLTLAMMDDSRHFIAYFFHPLLTRTPGFYNAAFTTQRVSSYRKYKSPGEIKKLFAYCITKSTTLE